MRAGPCRPRFGARSVQVEPLANGFETGALNVAIDPKTLALTVSDRQGRRIHTDAAKPMSFDGNGFTLRKTMPVGEQYYGLGDKTGPFDRRGASYVHWNTDAWGFDRGTDPIYKSIPFYDRERRRRRRLRPVPRQ